jgi:branched-chain amino acid transport system substrate-binding protein
MRSILNMAAIMLLSMVLCNAASAADKKVKIGVLVDLSVSPESSGPGIIEAAKMAVADFGNIPGFEVEVVSADFQLKPDIATGIARRWFDAEGVDAIVGLPGSASALAVQEIARQLRKTLLITGAVASELTGSACSPYSTQWSDDTFALTRIAGSIAREGARSWFFVTADNALGKSLQSDATEAIAGAGGKVVGQVRHPQYINDFSSFLLQAQSSKSNVIALANVQADAVTAMKQAGEFGILGSDQKVVGFTLLLYQIKTLGLAAAQSILVTDSFYWDKNDQTRAFGKEILKRVGRMANNQQAASYVAVSHYLKALRSIGTSDAAVINAEMRRLPADFFGQQAQIRPDGRVLYDLGLYQVKKPAESKGDWDLYKFLKNIPAREAFRPRDETACSAAKLVAN